MVVAELGLDLAFQRNTAIGQMRGNQWFIFLKGGCARGNLTIGLHSE